MANLDQARDLLTFDDDQLLTLLAQGSAEYNRKAQADYSPRDFGESLYKSLRPRLETAICPLYCKQRDNWIAEDGAETVLIVAAWLEHHVLGYPVLTLSALVVKRGLKSLCTCT